MGSDIVTCRVRLQLRDRSLVPLDQNTDIALDTRKQWAEHLIKTSDPKSNASKTIRPLDIILLPDGTAEIRHVPAPEDIDNKEPVSEDEDETHHEAVYPAPYRIPPHIIADLDLPERVIRAECFAMGSVLYELFNNWPPFDRRPAETIQQLFSAAEFPKNVLSFPKWPMILSCWSREFAAELQKMCQYPDLLSFLRSPRIANMRTL